MLKTQEQVLQTLTKIKESGELGTADKSKPWVLAGLSPAFTKIDINIWNQTPTNTNANESAHANINQDGCSLSHLAAIYQFHVAKTYEKYNVKDSYQNKSELAHLTLNAKKT
ncbi:21797_t:CDS:2, partial [Racocetra persica]